ncbi:hypothetical protein D6D10_09135, partial [Aureobasidium pullulans]
GGQGYLFLVLSPFARRGILFVSGLFRLPYFPSRLPVSSQQSRKHTPRYSSTYIKAKRQHLSHHDQSLISHLVSTIDKPSHISYSSRAGPNIGSHTHYVRSELITSSPDRMFGVIELGLGEEWFGVSRSTTAADKATHKRS